MKERAVLQNWVEANSASWTLKRIASVEGIVAVGMAKATTTNRVRGVGLLKRAMHPQTTSGKARFFNKIVEQIVLLKVIWRVFNTIPVVKMANPPAPFPSRVKMESNCVGIWEPHKTRIKPSKAAITSGFLKVFFNLADTVSPLSPKTLNAIGNMITLIVRVQIPIVIALSLAPKINGNTAEPTKGTEGSAIDIARRMATGALFA